MVKILIADDDSGTCETLADILTAHGCEVRTVEDGGAALKAARDEHFQVALIDQRMPTMEGLATVRELRRTRACDDIYVITAYAEPGFVRRALMSGATHVFVKPIDIPLILQAIGGCGGDRPSPRTASARSDGTATLPIGGLTHREFQVLALIAQGKHNREIAAELSLSPRTVDRHVGKILTQLDVPTRSAAAAFAVRHRLV